MAGGQAAAGIGIAAIPAGGLVMSRGAWSTYGQARVGDEIAFYLDGARHTRRLAGVVSEIGPAALYVSQADLTALAGWGDASNDFRLRSTDAGGMLSDSARKQVETVIGGLGATVSLAFSETTFRSALTGHSAILSFSLYFLSILLGIVGLIGLSSALGSSVAERRREFGVMRTIGATPQSRQADRARRGIRPGVAVAGGRICPQPAPVIDSRSLPGQSLTPRGISVDHIGDVPGSLVCRQHGRRGTCRFESRTRRGPSQRERNTGVRMNE